MRGIANKMEKLGKQTFENIAGITKGVFEFSITSVDKAEELSIKESGLLRANARAENKDLCDKFSDYLSQTNPLFDKTKFMDACIVEK